jgi:uncharacterized membrane protein
MRDVRREAHARRVEFVAECFWTGVTEADLARLDVRARKGVEQTDVRYLGSMLMPEDDVVFCFFDGASHDAVAAVATRAEIPFERIVESVRSSERREE